MKGKICIPLLVALIVMTGCRRDHEYYILDIENPGQIAIPEDIEPPVNITIIPDDDDGGDGIEVNPGDIIDVEEGNYLMVVTRHDQGMVIRRTIATLPAAQDGLVPVAPPLLADVVKVTVYANKITIPLINLRPMTRQVHLRLSVAGVTLTNIASVRATLTGVANVLNLQHGFGSVSATGNTHSSVQMQGYQAGSLLEFRLLGTMPAVDATMTIELTTTGGDVHRLQTSVASALSGFNKGTPANPVLLHADLIVKTGAGMSGTIKPWKPGWEGEIEATE